MPGCPPLFLPAMVSSSQGKVVSATLGMPPPELDTQEIGHSLGKEIGHSVVIDQDEESILSNRYSDHHSSTVDSSTIWGKHTVHSSMDKEQKPMHHQALKTKMDISLATRTVTKIA